ncbi:MAG: hypothetical protein VB857_13815, partial [Pirellulaceae bacterium]
MKQLHFTIGCLALAALVGCGGDDGYSSNDRGSQPTAGQGAGAAKGTPPAIDIWKASAEGHLDVVKQHLAVGANIDTPFVVAGIRSEEHT